MGSTQRIGNNGAFTILTYEGVYLAVIASDQDGWEHVSVSRPRRCPSWAEMCQVKDLFWAPEEYVIQYHPPKSEYVNCHPYCLHMWRPIGQSFPTPPRWMVGPA